MEYSPIVLDHFRHPRRAGRPLPGQAGTACGTAETPAANAELRLYLKLKGAVVADAWFMAHGCPCTIATGSWLAEWAVGKSVQQLQELNPTEIAQQLELSAVKRYCAVMAQDALRAALAPIDLVSERK